MFARKAVARALDGQITRSGTIRARFPGSDRMFEIDLDADHPDGFKVIGYYNGPKLEAVYAHVRSRLRNLLDAKAGA